MLAVKITVPASYPESAARLLGERLDRLALTDPDFAQVTHEIVREGERRSVDGCDGMLAAQIAAIVNDCEDSAD